MNLNHKIGSSAGFVAITLAATVLASCSDSDDDSAEPRTSPAQTAPATVVPQTTTNAYFLDLRTGRQTPLSSTSTDDFGSGTPFDEGNYYAASPDGSRIYWERGGHENVSAEASSDASQGGRVDPEGYIDYYAGGWSPDGTKFVYQRRDGRGDDFGNLYVKDVVSGRAKRITDLAQRTEVGWWYLEPTFSPDSQNVIFQYPRDLPSGKKFALWSVPVTGGEAPKLLFRNGAQATTSTKNTYAFVRPISGHFLGSRLMIAAPDGVRILVEATDAIFEPKMSPDGKKIVYADDDDIYVVDVSTGDSEIVAEGRRMATWLDNDTLIVPAVDD